MEGRTFGPDDVVDWILHCQYVDHAGDPLQDTRRDDLGLIAAAVMRAVDGRDWKADRLGRELAAAAQVARRSVRLLVPRCLRARVDSRQAASL